MNVVLSVKVVLSNFESFACRTSGEYKENPAYGILSQDDLLLKEVFHDLHILFQGFFPGHFDLSRFILTTF